MQVDLHTAENLVVNNNNNTRNNAIIEEEKGEGVSVLEETKEETDEEKAAKEKVKFDKECKQLYKVNLIVIIILVILCFVLLYGQVSSEYS